MTFPGAHPLEAVAAEIEAHVGRAGWDAGPSLFALVATERLVAEEPATASSLGLAGAGYTPVEQDELPGGDLETMLARIGWPDGVAGCAVSQEIVLLPPQVEAELAEDPAAAARHPLRREARLVVAVLREGDSAAVLRLRAGATGGDDDLLTGADLAPNLVQALLATFG